MVNFCMQLRDLFKFSGSAAKPDTPEPKRVLNYVWINVEKFEPREGGPTTGLPHYINIAIENALRYPETQTNIWMDFNLLDQGSIDAARSLVSDAKIKICNLQDIKAYKDRSEPGGVFDPERQLSEDSEMSISSGRRKNIWGRVDFAKILVLEHCLKETDAEEIFYSDFDVPDVSVDIPEVTSRLRNHGIMTAWVGEYEYGQTGRLENGYIAIGREKLDRALFNKIIERTEEEVQQGLDGYDGLERPLMDWAREKYPWTKWTGDTVASQHERLDRWLSDHRIHWGLQSGFYSGVRTREYCKRQILKNITLPIAPKRGHITEAPAGSSFTEPEVYK